MMRGVDDTAKKRTGVAQRCICVTKNSVARPAQKQMKIRWEAVKLKTRIHAAQGLRRDNANMSAFLSTSRKENIDEVNVFSSILNRSGGSFRPKGTGD